MAQVGDWEGELLLLSFKALAMPGRFLEEGSVFRAGEQHGRRKRRWE